MIAFSMVCCWMAAARAQEPAPDRNDAVRVFLDCPACDENYLRTEITFVNYVRDPAAADVHLLVTTQGTGGGGIEYAVKFIGLGRYKGVDNALVYAAPQTATPDERRRGLASLLKLGLVRYVTETPLAARLQLQFDTAGESPVLPVADRWNFWVYRIGGNGDFEGEESTSERAVSAFFSANRTTDEWKIGLNGFGNYRLERFDLEEEGTLTAVRRNYQAGALVARSLTPHWSVGATAAIASSTFTNYDFRARIAPAVEYNIFPYAESTRRVLTLLYSIGAQTANYSEETIYGTLEERLVDHQLEASLGLRQPWGVANASFETSQYLNRRGRYRVRASGGLDVRLFKGFSVGLNGGVSRRRDQLSLRRGTASTEQILIRQRELATDYSFDLGFGVSYSFGSIFNNTVNPRFRNAGGF